MQVTDEVRWDLADFLAAAILVGSVGLAFELAARVTADRMYLAAVGVALATALLLVWLNLAAGLIGSEDNPLNLLVGGVLATGLVGVVAARFRPAGMALALVATAVAQVLLAVIATAAEDSASASLWPLTALFATSWLLSAWLFGKAVQNA
jgi:hypothetical protein